MPSTNDIEQYKQIAQSTFLGIRKPRRLTREEKDAQLREQVARQKEREHVSLEYRRNAIRIGAAKNPNCTKTWETWKTPPKDGEDEDNDVNCDVDGYLMEHTINDGDLHPYPQAPLVVKIYETQSSESAMLPANVTLDLRKLSFDYMRELLRKSLNVNNLCRPGGIAFDAIKKGVVVDYFGNELTLYTDFAFLTRVQEGNQNVTTGFIALKHVDLAFASKKGLPWHGAPYMYITLVCSKVGGTFRMFHAIACHVARLYGCNTMVLASMPSVVTLYQKFGYIPFQRARPSSPVSVLLLPVRLRRAPRPGGRP